jgi:predicted RNA-binding Zn-ribbon protein involved in translation (DUF1610 family)
MTLVKLVVNTVSSFGYICVACRKFGDSSHGGYADLDGKAFHCFYCPRCGDEITETLVSRMPESAPAERQSKML